MDIDILGSYPIILDGEIAGEVTVNREGLFWSFDAKCEMRGEIVRLSVYGDGSEGYLGIMEPIGDMLRLTKKLSRSALGSFPKKISHAGQKGELENEDAEAFAVIPQAHDNSQYNGEFPLSYYNKDNLAVSAPPEDNIPPPNRSDSPLHTLGELIWRPCPLPCSLFSGVEAKRICSYITGAFLAQDEDICYLAVPEDVAQMLPNSSSIRFVSKIYFSENSFLICKIIQGKSVSEL